MKCLRDEMEIVNAYELVGTYRGAAALCGTTAKTVKRVLERRAAGQVGRRPSPPRARNTAAVMELIRQKVRATDGRISAKRLLATGRAAGYTGSTAQLPSGSGRSQSQLEQAAADLSPVGSARPASTWSSTGPKRRSQNVFCAVLAWSRFRFVRFGADQTRATTLALLAECFEELGGVPEVVLTDRMGCLKAGVVANVVVPHPEYVAFATRFGFRPDFCEAADPESKGLVEHLCGYVQTDLIVPALLEPGLARPGDGQRRRTRLVRRSQRPGPQRDRRRAV